MTKIITALVALTLVTAVAAPSYAFDFRNIPTTATNK